MIDGLRNFALKMRGEFPGLARARLREFAELDFAIYLQRVALERRHAPAIAGVVVLHILFIWLIVLSLRTSQAHLASRELQVTVFEPKVQTLPAIPLPQTDAPVMEVPAIIVPNDEPAATINAFPAAMVLAPRPDPLRANVPPTAAQVGAKGDGVVAVLLKILVMPDGSVSDATIVNSSGQADADRAAIGFVEANWRFIPAMLNGTAIQYWTTVAVPFKA